MTWKLTSVGVGGTGDGRELHHTESKCTVLSIATYLLLVDKPFCGDLFFQFDHH